jgi:hypothetical protein
MMNDLFQEYLNDFVVIYLNDILIFFKNKEEHEKHVCLILKKLHKQGLCIKLEKCSFHQTEMLY